MNYKDQVEEIKRLTELINAKAEKFEKNVKPGTYYDDLTYLINELTELLK